MSGQPGELGRGGGGAAGVWTVREEREKSKWSWRERWQQKWAQGGGGSSVLFFPLPDFD